jgi:hypothetical protein
MYHNCPDVEIASWQNQLIDDYDLDYAPGERPYIGATEQQISAAYRIADKKRRETVLDNLSIDAVTPEQWDAIDKATDKARDTMIGGDHYRQGSIQPIEYIHANNLSFCEGNVVKYVTRWRHKDGLKDLEKAKHYIELLMELEDDY